MNFLQAVLLLFIGIGLLGVLIKGLDESRRKKNAYRETPFLFLAGIFVWGDAVIFGPFWIIAAFWCYWMKDWVLFVLVVAVFWVVRSLGETIYWLNQQFSTIERNPPRNLRGYELYRGDAIWFGYQTFWQSVMVVSIIATIYLASLWRGRGRL